MPNPAMLNQAARILAEAAEGRRADLVLRERLRGRGSWLERREIARAVFGYFRWLRWLDARQPEQARLAAALALADRFAADERSVKAEALAARAVPDWLRLEMDAPVTYLRQLQREPALWIRARPGTRGRLAAELGDCEETGLAADALRYRGSRDLFRTRPFGSGEFEIQDLASQAVGAACAPAPGQAWWDACAGEGGKSLHLADLMGNRGVVWATDRNSGRLETLRRRAARGGLFNIRIAAWDGGSRPPNRTRFDGVLVDAPCSGIGTWQRNPQARWTTRHGDVRELAAVQRSLLENACGSVKPGGRLVYAVCTLSRTETAAVADAFSADHPEFGPEPAIVLRPGEIDANGMFVAAWRRA
jgi:16S rRNA (cytosine967-C5)-methyltransferase